MAMAAPSFGGGQNNVMLMRGDLGSSNSLVAMLNGFQVARSGGGLEDIAACGQKRPLSYTSYAQPAFEGGVEEAELEDGMEGEAVGQVEKKRRLSFDQVRSLEKNFELENKLEPERKMQLAKELGLQPRQVAVWFQNRRARWKTKQLERDYEMLNTGYLKLKADFEAALREKDALKAKVQRLSGKTTTTSHDSHSDVESSQCESPKKNSECTKVSSDGSNEDSSSELLDADSPRGTTGDAADNLVASYCDDFPAPESLCELAFPVKLEDGYFLPAITDAQSVLPWWDWA